MHQHATMRHHPTSAAHINRETLAILVAEVGPQRVAVVERRIVPHNGGWFVDAGLFLAPATLHQAGVQVAFRIPGQPLRHLPLPMDAAKTWAAAWVLLLAHDNGQDTAAITEQLAQWPAPQDIPA